MRIAKIVFVVLTVLLVIGGHIGLWSSDAYPREMKAKLTLLNALGWAAILLPAYGVSRWAARHEDERD